MCGFVAIFDRARGVNRPLVDHLRDRLVHRGPDDAGTWIDDSAEVGLGHRRLSILDLSDAGHQPMHGPQGRYVLVFNGEIYNFVELRGELEAKGHAFVGGSDSEVLLAGFIEWGPAVLERLNGMFSFVIWDRRERRMFCARDRFGEKPFFYAALPEGRGLVMGSEMKALLAHPDVACEQNDAVVERFLAGVAREDQPETCFVGLRRLLPGHAMWIGAEGRVERLWRYWGLDLVDVDYGISRSRALHEFRQRLIESIRIRLRADVPVGSSLSGGLDSSWIVGCLTKELQASGAETVNTFSARFECDPTMSEGPDIDRVLDYTGARGYSVGPSPLRLAEESRALHYHQEEPFFSTSIYLQWCVARLAKEQGTTILIDGQGADEVLGGYASYFSLYQRDLIDRGKLFDAFLSTALFKNRLRHRAAQIADIRRRIGDIQVLGLRQLARSALLPDVPADSLYSGGIPPAHPALRFRQRRAEALYYNNLPTLLRYADRNAMAFSREPRLPYLDHTLVEFACRLPDEYLVHRGWQKWILRQSGEGLIPDATRWRADKVGYAAPQDNWFRHELREWMAERLFDSRVASAPGYDRAAVETLWKSHLKGQDLSWVLWRYASLAEWLDLLATGAWEPEVPASREAASA